MSGRARSHVAIPGALPASFSDAVAWNGLIVTSGHFGVELGGAPVPFREQAERTLTALLDTLAKLGGGPESILKVNAYLATMGDFPVWDEVYRALLPLAPMPARTSVAVGDFVAPMLIELDCIAYRLDG